MCISQFAIDESCSCSISQNMKIGVLTYDVKHRKTFDTLCLLKAKGYKNITVYAQPMTYQKQYEPQLVHRPALIMDIPCIRLLCANFDFEYYHGRIDNVSFPDNMILLVCGAGIIPEYIWKKHTVINAHPGYIPLVRGLDAFKWAIWEEKPIGVTTHIIGQYVDAGEIIDRREIQMTKNTTFFEAAQMVYENEISMLVEAVERVKDVHTYMEPGDNVIHRRMPHDIENMLLKRFEKYKQVRCISE